MPRLTRRTRLLGLSAIVALPLLLYGALVVRLVRHEHSLNVPPARGRLRVATADAHVPGMQDIQIPAGNNVSIGAWYVPPTHGTVVVLTHGSGADRSSTLPELRVLSAAGIGVLAFDWPGHGTSGGESHWGRDERRALTQVVTWLTSRPDVDTTQLGVIGFSIGGYITAQVAATDPRIKRVALIATPTDAEEQTIGEYRRYGRLSGWLVVKANEWYGIERDTLKARDVVSHIAPRPLLVITGALDHAVPTEMSDTLFARAGDPKMFARLPRSAHGDYIAKDSSAYVRLLVEFFQTGTVHEPAAAVTTRPPAGVLATRRRTRTGAQPL